MLLENSVTATFERDLQNALKAEVQVAQLRELMKAAAKGGLSRDAARRMLERARDSADTAAMEDRTLELLDVVSDFCAVSLRIAWTR